MRALAVHGKRDIRVEDAPVPVPGDGEVRIRVAFVGICGSDLHYYELGANGDFVIREPLVLGHELSGTVDDDPSGRFAAGTAVTVHPARFGRPVPGLGRELWPGGSYLGSAATTPHTQGAMADYLVVDAGMVRPLPESLPLPRAALAEPLAVALHGIAVAGGVEGRTVLVSGSGPIGLLAAAACLAKGAAHVVSTDVVPSSLKLARALGVPETIDVSSAAVRTDSVDVALECSGATPGISVAIRATRPGGVVGQVGMVPGGPQPVVLAPYIAKELTLRGSFRFDDEIDEAIAILAERSNIDTVIGAVFGVRDVEEAFAVAKDPMRPGKVLVDMSK